MHANAADVEAEFLRRLNVDLPEGVDWKQGAVTYLRELVQDGGVEAEWFHLVKPFVGGPDFGPFWVDVFHFLDVVHKVDLPSRSVVVDVGCGPGWTVQWLAKLGHEVVGLDISAELLALAEQRMRTDPHTPFFEEPFHYELRVHDIEAEPLGLERPARLALFESTLHHFFDPVAALRNTAADLAPDGLVAVIEAAAPPVGSEWHAQNVELMRRYRTIERPYTRDQLHEALALAGLPHVAFYQPVNGLFRQQADELAVLSRTVARSDHLNICLAAATPEALARVERGPAPPSDPPTGLRFLDGVGLPEVGPDGSTYRWAGPRVVMAVDDGGPHRVHVSNPTLEKRGVQHVYLLVDDRVVQQVELSARSSAAELVLDVPAHSVVELQSDRAFSPSWRGEPDARVLSFRIAAPPPR
ncbi:MAG: cap guanine-N2 methyltransferase family protein [Acidimicrobiales bacterium]|nr:cap guanine-N2 methyltransferase family protein [Acidimicrobiales bacterium]